MHNRLEKEIQEILKTCNYTLEIANIKDIDNILCIYSERMKWFKDNNIKQWSNYLKNHPKEEFVEIINDRHLYMLKQHKTIIAVFVIDNNSSLWKSDDNRAYYISKIAVKTGYKGIGKIIIEIAKSICINDNKKYLRLECVKNNIRLNQIYVNYGFKLKKTGKEKYSYCLRELIINEESSYRNCG